MPNRIDHDRTKLSPARSLGPRIVKDSVITGLVRVDVSQRHKQDSLPQITGTKQSRLPFPCPSTFTQTQPSDRGRHPLTTTTTLTNRPSATTLHFSHEALLDVMPGGVLDRRCSCRGIWNRFSCSFEA